MYVLPYHAWPPPRSSLRPTSRSGSRTAGAARRWSSPPIFCVVCVCVRFVLLVGVSAVCGFVYEGFFWGGLTYIHTHIQYIYLSSSLTWFPST